MIRSLNAFLNNDITSLQEMATFSDHCAALASPDIPNLVLSMYAPLFPSSSLSLTGLARSFLVLGILASYISQHYRIITRRSSEGLSPYFVLLGTLASTCTFANILALPTSQEDLGCCKEINSFACFAALLGILQIGVIWACFFLMYVLASYHAAQLATAY